MLEYIIILNKVKYILDLNRVYDISIPLDFNGEQPNFYKVNKAIVHSLKSNDISWSVSKGAPCNVPEISLNIHCNATHTEGVGHLLSSYKSLTWSFQSLT